MSIKIGFKVMNSEQRYQTPLANILIYIIAILILNGCANSKYFAGVPLPPKETKLININPIAQTKSFACGYSSLASVALYYDVNLTSLMEGEVQEKFSNKSLSAVDIIQIATTLQLRVFAYQGSYEDLSNNIRDGRPILILLKKPLRLYNYPSINWAIQTSSSLLGESHWTVK